MPDARTETDRLEGCRTKAYNEDAPQRLAIGFVLVEDHVEWDARADDFDHHCPDILVGRPPRQVACTAKSAKEQALTTIVPAARPFCC